MHHCLMHGNSVPYITVTVAYKVQELESNSKQTGAQQISQSREVRYCRVIRIYMLCPHPVNHYVTDVQKHKNLATETKSVRSLSTPKFKDSRPFNTEDENTNIFKLKNSLKHVLLTQIFHFFLFSLRNYTHAHNNTSRHTDTATRLITDISISSQVWTTIFLKTAHIIKKPVHNTIFTSVSFKSFL